MDNLLDALLRLAPARGEDSITETFAWLLRHDTALCARFVALLRRGREGALPESAPTVYTQVTEGDARYDLQLDWRTARAVIEVKVDAALGWRTVDAEVAGAPTAESQVAKYLRRANAPGRAPTWVFTLAAEALPLEASTRAHERWGAELRWHDVRVALEVEPSADPSVARIATWFLDALRRRGMTYEPLSRESLAAVAPYLAFKRTIDAMIDHAYNALKGEPGFRALAIGGTWRQEAHQRIGWVFSVNRSAGYFGFLGVSVHPNALRDGAPDLLFFLEAPPKSDAAATLRGERAEWEAEVAALHVPDAVRWALGDGWPIVSATQDLSALLAAEDQTRAMTTWYRERMADVSRTNLLARYLAATGAVKPAGT